MKKFVARAVKKSNYGGLRAYDNVYILKTVIERHGVTNRPGDLSADRARIREGLDKLDNYDGVVGPTSFDEHGDGSGKATVLVVKDGKFEKVEY
jgi:branched-chain amino acid transport system substrate-binding protein